MERWIRKLADDLGAQIIAELPENSAGAIGAAHAASFYHRRMEDIRRQDSEKTPAVQFRTIPVDESV